MKDKNDLAFNSQQEIWKYVSNGGKVTDGTHTVYFDDNGVQVTNDGEVTEVWSWFFDESDDWSKVVEWYEDIPEHGVLCLTKIGEGVNKTPSIRVITRVSDDGKIFFTDVGNRYADVIPLTNNEIKGFFRGER